VAHERTDEIMQGLARAIDGTLPGLAFSLFIWPTDEQPSEGNVNYVSNVPRAQRDEIAAMMRAVLRRWEGDQQVGR